MIVDEFADLWARATAAEQTQIRALIEKFYETPASKALKRQAEEVLTFLNEKTKCNYRHIDTNLKPIICLLKSGVSQEQIYAVIAMMYRKWANDPKMEDYLRPKTLFNKSNFENYLGKLGK